MHGPDGKLLEDIRTAEDSSALADFIIDFIRRQTADPSRVLHCSVAGGRKTMGLYLGLALQLHSRGVNRPLNSHPELREVFDRVFDGFEVVPASLEAEYRALERESPLQAPFLRVPISHRQRERLIRLGRLDRSEEIARAPYDEIRGLDLTFRDDDA